VREATSSYEGVGEEALEILDGELDGFADQFPHLRRLVHATLEAAGVRYDSAAEELSRIAELKALGDAVDRALGAQVQWCREILRYSWADIGEELGVSRQAARQRFATDADAGTPESDRLAAEAEYLLAKMRADAAKAAMQEGAPTDAVQVDAADFERYVETRRERHRLAQQALEGSDGEGAGPLKGKGR